MLLLLSISLPTILADTKLPLTTGSVSSNIDTTNAKLSISKFAGSSSIDLKCLNITSTGSLIDGKTKFTQLDYTANIYTKTNSIEYELILNKTPKTNIFTFTLNLLGCTAIYQPPLNLGIQDPRWTGLVNATRAYSKDGTLICERPPNVVGSYAIYSPNIDNQFQTGKIGHLYRPSVSDAKGNFAWCDMVLVGNTLTVTIPSDFLKSAVYPVILDPTFGYDVQGGSFDHNYNGPLGQQGTPAFGGTAQSISMYVKDDSTDDIVFQGALYNNASPSNSLTTSSGDTSEHLVAGVVKLISCSINSYVITGSTVYQAWFQAHAAHTVWVCYDAGSGSLFSGSAVYPFVWNNQSWVTGGVKYSIYCTYTSSTTITTTTNTTLCTTEQTTTVTCTSVFPTTSVSTTTYTGGCSTYLSTTLTSITNSIGNVIVINVIASTTTSELISIIIQPAAGTLTGYETTTSTSTIVTTTTTCSTSSTITTTCTSSCSTIGGTSFITVGSDTLTTCYTSTSEKTITGYITSTSITAVDTKTVNGTSTSTSITDTTTQYTSTSIGGIVGGGSNNWIIFACVGLVIIVAVFVVIKKR